MLKVLISAMVYVGSYLPLTIILLVQDFQLDAIGRPFCAPWPSVRGSICTIPLDHPLLALSALVISATCFAMTLLLLAAISPKRSLEIIETKHIPADLLNYVIPYVVAFMSLDYGNVGKLFGLLIFFAAMFVLTYRAGQIALNPLLIAFGWKLFEVKYGIGGGKSVLVGRVLSNTDIQPNVSYPYSTIQDVLIVKTRISEL